MIKTKEIEVPDVIYEKGDKRLEIFREQQSIDPRTADTVGIMRCNHKRYDLGDERASDEAQSWKDVRDNIEEENPLVVLPLYLYDHSGLHIKVGSFAGQLPQGHARFDSGQVGYIYTTEERLEKLGVETRDEDKLEKWLRQETERYNKYLEGQIYRFVLYENGEQVDSCGGYYGTEWSENGLLDATGIGHLEDWDRETNR